jgi:predicted Zn-dependent protease
MALPVSLAYVLPQLRAHETEADALAMELAARAGYDVRVAPGLFKRIKAEAKRNRSFKLLPERLVKLLSTHPDDEVRAADCQEIVKAVQAT